MLKILFPIFRDKLFENRCQIQERKTKEKYYQIVFRKSKYYYLDFSRKYGFLVIPFFLEKKIIRSGMVYSF
jgi:hypothetical protein